MKKAWVIEQRNVANKATRKLNSKGYLFGNQYPYLGEEPLFCYSALLIFDAGNLYDTHLDTALRYGSKICFDEIELLPNVVKTGLWTINLEEYGG